MVTLSFVLSSVLSLLVLPHPTNDRQERISSVAIAALTKFNVVELRCSVIFTSQGLCYLIDSNPIVPKITLEKEAQYSRLRLTR